MGIRFRCTNCNQFMGIARRKAGARVRCPSCRQEIAVPAQADDESPLQAPAPAPVLAPTAPRADLFDRDDFDALLRGSVSTAGARPPSPVERRPVGTPAPSPSILAEANGGRPRPVPAALSLAPPRGIALSPTWATLLTVTFVLLLALTFALGLLVGRYAL